MCGGSDSSVVEWVWFGRHGRVERRFLHEPSV